MAWRGRLPPSHVWMSRTVRGTAAIRRLAESLPAVVVLAAVAAVLIPLPSWGIDLLATLSLTGALVVLVAALLVGKPSEFLPFPPLLLLLTLGRLALNLSTTRAILTRGEAGKVIEAFGSLVVRDEIVVGVVMFSIITAVQYLVIVRGAERAAEVGARFALDALPGHQAAIEADLRAGLFNGREAAQRRGRLAERSDFFGRMDGALRFVKGEALVGLVILAINAGAGTLLGVLRDHLSIAQSAALYLRLTVGDGLATQIPALLVSVAAGILVARVEREKVAWDITWLRPAMLAWPGVLLLLLACIDGMPSLSFVAVALALLGLSLLLSQRRPSDVGSETPLWVEVPAAHVHRLPDLQALIAPVAQRVGQSFGVRPIELSGRISGRENGFSLRYRGQLLWHGALALQQPSDRWLPDVSRILTAEIERWIDVGWLEEEFERLRPSHPNLSMGIPAAVGVAGLALLLRAWVRERLALPQLTEVIAVLSDDECFSQSKEREAWYGRLRELLVLGWLPDRLAELAHTHTPSFIRLTPDAEEAIAQGSELGGSVVRFHGRPEHVGQWRQTIAARLAQSETMVILVTSRVRRAVAELVRPLGGRIAVVSLREYEAAGFDLLTTSSIWLDLEPV